MTRTDFIAYAVLAAPIFFVVLMWIDTAGALIAFGLIATYGGIGIAAFFSQMPILFGLNGALTGLSLATSGVTIMAFGGMLAAILRSLKKIHPPGSEADGL